jgi:hypothetical protein
MYRARKTSVSVSERVCVCVCVCVLVSRGCKRTQAEAVREPERAAQDAECVGQVGRQARTWNGFWAASDVRVPPGVGSSAAKREDGTRGCRDGKVKKEAPFHDDHWWGDSERGSKEEKATASELAMETNPQQPVTK